VAASAPPIEALKKDGPATPASPDLARQAPASAPLPPPASPERARAAEGEPAKPGAATTIGPRGFDAGGFAQGGAAAPQQREADVRERRAAPSPFPAARESAPAEAASRDQPRAMAEEAARSTPPAALGGVRQDAAPRGEARLDAKRESVAKQQAASPPVESRVEDRVALPPAPPLADGRVQAAPAPAAVPPPPAKALVRAAPKPPARPAWLVELDYQPPERWLDKLAEFRHSDRNADAEELLAEFRKRFPDHPASAR
jgi:hypothetical protein